MRIAVFVSNYPPHSGGLEVIARNIAQGLGERHEVVIVTSAWADRQGRSEENGVVVHRLPTLHVSERWGVPYPLPKGPGIRAALDAVAHADLYHVHGALYFLSTLGAWAARAARRESRPLLLTEHVGFVHYRSHALNALQRAAWGSIGRFVVGSAAGVTVYNTRVQHWISSTFPHKRLEYIANGVDTARFRPQSQSAVSEARRQFGLPSQEPIVLFVGRDAEKKNLDAVVSIPRDDFTLVVCGAPHRVSAERVVDLGVVPYERMPDLFGAADLMVHASSGEGFPAAVQEAMASGVAVVLLWDPGYARTLDESAVEPAHGLDQLPAALRRLVTSPNRRRKLGATGCRWAVEHWAWRNTVDAYEKFMCELIDERHCVPHGAAAATEEALDGPS